MPFYLISTLHAWNCRLVPVIGFPLNALLLWLVWTKTPKEMRVHSRCLLQTCCVDLAFICVCLVASPLLIYKDFISVVFFDGYFTRIFASNFNYSPMYLNIMNLIYCTSFAFDIYSISVQFIYRYLILTRNIEISLSRYLFMLTLPLIASLIVGIFYALGFSDVSVLINDEMKASLNGYVDWENSIYIIDSNNQPVWMVFFFGVTIFYSINLFCGVKLVKFVRAHAFNPRTKELNQQLTKTLIILALFPLLTLFFNLTKLVLIAVMNITGIKYFEKIILNLQNFAFLCGNWIPVINTIVGIWINTPYRDAVKKLAARLFKKNNSITPVQPINQ